MADHAVEFIIENLLAYTNAFPEKEEINVRHWTSCCQKIQAFPLFLYHPGISLLPPLTALPEHAYRVVNSNSQFLLEIAHPPPRLT